MLLKVPPPLFFFALKFHQRNGELISSAAPHIFCVHECRGAHQCMQKPIFFFTYLFYIFKGRLFILCIGSPPCCILKIKLSDLFAFGIPNKTIYIMRAAKRKLKQKKNLETLQQRKRT
jgi:hypothetical protein